MKINMIIFKGDTLYAYNLTTHEIIEDHVNYTCANIIGLKKLNRNTSYDDEKHKIANLYDGTYYYKIFRSPYEIMDMCDDYIEQLQKTIDMYSEIREKAFKLT